MKRIEILTIFPKMFAGPFAESIVQRAIKKQILELRVHDLRQWATDKHKSVDDRPYGGGPGMIIRVDVIDRAVRTIRQQTTDSRMQTTKVVLLSARGKRYTQEKAKQLATQEHLLLICGHYEGVDQRVNDEVADEVISIGDYVLTGGELAAMVVVDSIARLLPGALGDPSSLREESHAKPGYIEYPQYTRPKVYRGWKVPEMLLSGDHGRIAKWKADRLEKLKR